MTASTHPPSALSRVLVLDTGPLGLLSHRRGVPLADACRKWLSDCMVKGTAVIVPEVADYEVRRQRLRASKTAGVARLDAFNAAEADRYRPLTTAAMRLAADLWARSRIELGTADPKEQCRSMETAIETKPSEQHSRRRKVRPMPDTDALQPSRDDVHNPASTV